MFNNYVARFLSSPKPKNNTISLRWKNQSRGGLLINGNVQGYGFLNQYFSDCRFFIWMTKTSIRINFCINFSIVIKNYLETIWRKRQIFYSKGQFRGGTDDLERFLRFWPHKIDSHQTNGNDKNANSSKLEKFSHCHTPLLLSWGSLSFKFVEFIYRTLFYCFWHLRSIWGSMP